ncbi:glycosyltransferase family 1 protein [Pseudomonas gingeri]|nr:glycosyltransferase family 1 protein [Pseudomonas gingeri]
MRQLSVDSCSLVVSQNYLAYSADVELHRPGQSFLIRELKRLWAILFFLPRFDVIHYNSGTTLACAYAFTFSRRQGARAFVRRFYAGYLRLLQRFEVAYVRLLGKAVFVTYQGDDARQGDYSRKHFTINIANEVEEGYYCDASDEFKRCNIKMLASIASQIYSVNPDLLHVLPQGARFTPYSHVFLDEWLPSYTQDQNRPLRIVHAPSNRKVKGSDLILRALESLRGQGFEFELLLVEGMSNAEARKVYESADVLVDQLFAGWYGGLAVELMALGKPVLVYIRDEDLVFIPPAMKADLPFLQITPYTVEDTLRLLLLMPREELVALGRRSRAFVERWHDPMSIARAIQADYEKTLSLRQEAMK